MPHLPQITIPATYMRGGTSKGVFINLDDLPAFAQKPGPDRDALLLRIIGSPDPYAKHTDGMGGATSSTSKVVIISKSQETDHDVDYLFGQIAIDKPFVDWSGNCGNLSAAVAPFAISQGMLPAAAIPENGDVSVRIWQANIRKTIVAKVPITAGVVQETGDFQLDGVTFPAAEIEVAFMQPGPSDSPLFPTGALIDTLAVPGIGEFSATFINAGIPTIFLNAEALGYSGTELQVDINSDIEALEKFETIRAHGAIKMGLIKELEEAKTRQHTPKVAFVAPPQDYIASSGQAITSNEIDLTVRALSMGLLHHAMMGTAAVAIATAASIPGTLVNLAAGGKPRNSVVFGHPSGTLKVGAETSLNNDQWSVEQAIMSRSARILMDGRVHVPPTHV